MKKLMLASVVMFVISACSWLREDSAGYEKVSASATLTSDYLVDYVDTSGSVDLTYTLNLGSATKDVFFVFTNTSATKDVEAPYSLSVSGVSSDFEASSLLNKQDVSGGSRPESGKPEITEFNRDVAKRLSENPVSASSYSASVLYPETLTPSASSVGDNENFCINTSGATVSATCRKVVTVGTKTLNVFVANDCWHATATRTYEITQAMVDAYASKFLSDGTNDIYGLVTGIYGSEWGTNAYSSSLISAGNAGNITILLYDIDGDDSSNGGTLGYFWAKDNYLKSNYDKSNARLMFYIDAVMLANPTGTWEISDYWPDILVGTLAHEFQHMIHFYQKAVLRNAQSDTWLDEMCSLTTEDFVANRLGFSSPAAIRLPTFVSKNYEMGVTEWDSSSSNSYSEAYCFGSYLLRNYGGTDLFKNIQHSSYGDYRAVQEATGVDFGSLIRRWGAALVLSDKSTLSSDLIADKIVMNKAADFIDANTTYSYDSINLYSYNGTHNFYLSRGDLLSLYTQKAASNIIIKAGSSMSGTSVWKFRMTNPVKVTAVVK